MNEIPFSVCTLSFNVEVLGALTVLPCVDSFVAVCLYQAWIVETFFWQTTSQRGTVKCEATAVNRIETSEVTICSPTNNNGWNTDNDLKCNRSHSLPAKHNFEIIYSYNTIQYCIIKSTFLIFFSSLIYKKNLLSPHVTCP